MENSWDKIADLFDGPAPKPEDKFAALQKELGALRAENDEYARLFSLQFHRMTRAIRLWQRLTGNRDTHPDLGELLDWMVDLINKYRGARH